MSKVINTVGGGGSSKWQLVWTNASPTSSFAAQTIALDLSSFQEVQIVYRFSTGDNAIVQNTQMINSGIGAAYFFQGFPSSGAIGARRRYAKATSTGILFEDAQNKSGTSAASTDNDAMIPTLIYAR